MPPDSEEYARPATPPDTSLLSEVRGASRECTACHLYKRATQTVFGEGTQGCGNYVGWRTTWGLRRRRWQAVRRTRGENHGPRSGGSGNRSHVYVTNAVKHFKWEPRGKRRIHKKPNSREIAACRPWLEAELRLVKPQLVLCLGSTAGQAFFGPSFRVTRERGKVLSSKLAPKVVATVHPSSLLRQPDEESREREYDRFVVDLRAAIKAASEA
jgi:uracil-DNA glycosylase